MKYIGPFFRINTLNKSNIEKQLFFFSKEAIKHIVLESKCGISTPVNELKFRTSHNIDITTLKSFSPLLCLYKKASCNLVNNEKTLGWNEAKFRKIILVKANAYMTLSILEMVEFHKLFKDKEPLNYQMSHLYLALAKQQLEFYTSNLRNEYGLFVDKSDLTNSITEEPHFEENSKHCNFSDQALIMVAHYKYYLLSEDKDRDYYKNFSMEILNMFFQYKDEIYDMPLSDQIHFCFALSLLYNCSKEERVKLLLLDVTDLLIEKYKDHLIYKKEQSLEVDCFMYLNLILLFSYTDILKFKDLSNEIGNKLEDLYNPQLGMFIKEDDKKEVAFYCDEVIMYLIVMLKQSNNGDLRQNNDFLVTDIFKNQILNSGIIASWPESPDLDSAERYINFSRRSEDLIDEINFRMSSMQIPSNTEIAPVFLKNVIYNKKKQIFDPAKTSFDSNRNMFLLFLLLYFFKS